MSEAFEARNRGTATAKWSPKVAILPVLCSAPDGCRIWQWSCRVDCRRSRRPPPLRRSGQSEEGVRPAPSELENAVGVLPAPLAKADRGATASSAARDEIKPAPASQESRGLSKLDVRTRYGHELVGTRESRGGGREQAESAPPVVPRLISRQTNQPGWDRGPGLATCAPAANGAIKAGSMRYARRRGESRSEHDKMAILRGGRGSGARRRGRREAERRIFG